MVTLILELILRLLLTFKALSELMPQYISDPLTPYSILVGTWAPQPNLTIPQSHLIRGFFLSVHPFSLRRSDCWVISMMFHPSIFSCLSFSGSRESWNRSQLPSGKRQGTPWTGYQAVTGLTYRHRQPSAPMSYLEFPINLLSPLTSCLWTMGGSRNTRREPSKHGQNMQAPRRTTDDGI